MFVNEKWFKIPRDRTYAEIQCFPAQLQEPFGLSSTITA